jgi:peroxiredoxin
MPIRVGDKLPDGTLTEMIDVEKPGCVVGPNSFQVSEMTKGRKLLIFGLPGAFTPTCSGKHVPGYVARHDAIKYKGVDEIWCVAVNDAYVMGAWGKDQETDGKVRMLADGSALWTKALGLELDLTSKGMGIRMQRFAMVVDDGVVKTLNIETPGRFEVSDADTLLKALEHCA